MSESPKTPIKSPTPLQFESLKNLPTTKKESLQPTKLQEWSSQESPLPEAPTLANFNPMPESPVSGSMPQDPFAKLQQLAYSKIIATDSGILGQEAGHLFMSMGWYSDFRMVIGRETDAFGKKIKNMLVSYDPLGNAIKPTDFFYSLSKYILDNSWPHDEDRLAFQIILLTSIEIFLREMPIGG